ncbi:MAG TPA: DUF4965 domain-containing protein, partial [Limnochordia bacterium]|nr:DUF4965 domain-containing protein [Limnochordia bacterium]
MATAAGSAFRPPATPLIACDPYFSVWSMADRLTDEETRHWTGSPHPIGGLVRIDGNAYRLIGAEPRPIEPLPQTGLVVRPTRTVYTFAGAGVELTLTFTTAALPEDLERLARPVTYLTWSVRSTDGRPHQAALYLDVSALLTVNTAEQLVNWGRLQLGRQTALQIGSQSQEMLVRSGDNLRIDWGRLYLSSVEPAAFAIGQDRALREAFIAGGALPDHDDFDQPRPAQARRTSPALALSFDLGEIGADAVSRTAIVAYDDRYSIEYLGRKLRPYWRRNGDGAAELLRSAGNDAPGLLARCAAYDEALFADLTAAGGTAYAELCALAFRQCAAAHKLTADIDGTPLFFSKENFSNGCIATVDVTYPSAPFMLLFNPELLKGCLRPILQYAALPRWRFDFAPHDVGTYPLANGQVYGGGERTTERQMPVEECGNMLILVAALAQAAGDAEFARPHLTLLTRWADYLVERGFDPENQLCTDDFAGHLAHNANLSLKAIVALGAFAQVCARMGEAKPAAHYQDAARKFAAQWLEAADDGDHYRLTFDGAGTWSQKYNLVWDRLLGL